MTIGQTIGIPSFIYGQLPMVDCDYVDCDYEEFHVFLKNLGMSVFACARHFSWVLARECRWLGRIFDASWHNTEVEHARQAN